MTETNVEAEEDVPVADNSDTATSDELGPFGGNLWDVAIDPDNSDRVYTVAKDSPNGFYRSSDGGETWSEYAGTDLVESYEVFDEIINDINSTSTLYAAVSNNSPDSAKTGAVLQSTDQGITWTDLALPNGGSAQTITQAGNGDLYVGLGAESDEYSKTISTIKTVRVTK